MTGSQGFAILALVVVVYYLAVISQRLAGIKKTLDVIADNTLGLEKEREMRGW